MPDGESCCGAETRRYDDGGHEHHEIDWKEIVDVVQAHDGIWEQYAGGRVFDELAVIHALFWYAEADAEFEEKVIVLRPSIKIKEYG